MKIFSANEIIGKTLFARVAVPVYRLPEFSANPVFTVKPGEAIGVVYSYLDAKPGRPFVWTFLDKNNKAYYVRHDSKSFDLTALKKQGAKTTEEKEKESKPKTAGDRLEKIGKIAIFSILGFFIGREILKRI
jgi:hypothetical protein